jgi:N-acetylglucosamine-6-phosphate deacetylase
VPRFTVTGVLVDPLDGVRPGSVEIDDGRIVEVRDDPAATGPYVLPGFVDLHIYDSSDVLAQGVTGYLATVGPEARGVVEEFLAALPDDGVCLGAHVEGPYLHPEAAGALAIEHIRPVDVAELDGWLATSRVRLVTIAPDAEGGVAAIGRVATAGAVASIGHTRANVYTTRAAVDAGATFATHVWNAMSGWTARTPGAIGTLLADPRVTLGLIGDGRHLHPITEELTVRLAGPERIALTSDRVPLPAERENGKLLGGDRCGAALVRRAAERYGLREAVTMASLVPARALGLGDRGHLAPGRRADLALLTHELEPLATMAGGVWAWER